MKSALTLHELQILSEQVDADDRAIAESGSSLLNELATELDRRIVGPVSDATGDEPRCGADDWSVAR